MNEEQPLDQIEDLPSTRRTELAGRVLLVGVAWMLSMLFLFPLVLNVRWKGDGSLFNGIMLLMLIFIFFLIWVIGFILLIVASHRREPYSPRFQLIGLGYIVLLALSGILFFLM